MFILFDCFGTLVDYVAESLEEHFAPAIPSLRRAGYTGDARELHLLWQRVYAEMLAESLRSGDEFPFSTVCARTLSQISGLTENTAGSPSLAEGLAADLLATWRAAVREIPGVAGMLQVLGKRYTLAVISNTHHAPLVHGCLAEFGIKDCFAEIITSVEFGKRKPDAAIFQHAMKRLGATAEDCLFIGDNPVDDYAGACEAGIAAWLIDPRSAHRHVPASDRIAHILSVGERLPG